MESRPHNQGEDPILLKATPVSRPKQGLKLPLLLIFGPLALFVTNFTFYILFNLITSSAGDSLDVLRTVVNVLSFLVGIVVIFGGPISFVIGIILLANRSSQK